MHARYSCLPHFLPCLPGCLPAWGHTRLADRCAGGVRCRAIQDLHHQTAEELGVDAETRGEVDALLTQLQQLLVGISIMQVRGGRWLTGWLSGGGDAGAALQTNSRRHGVAAAHRVSSAAPCTTPCTTPHPLQDLTPRAKDSLVSFGERLSTRLFAAYLNAQGVPARQYDAPDIGVTTSDNFVNAEVCVAGRRWVGRLGWGCVLDSIRRAGQLCVAPERCEARQACSLRRRSCGERDVAAAPHRKQAACHLPLFPTRLAPCLPPPTLQVNYELTLPAVRESLTFQPGQQRHLPIVTGFLGRGLQTGAITTLGRGGSDLTCTLLGGALGLPEVQVWKDVDGVLTADPRVVQLARPVSELTFEEATELAFFGATVLHPLAMQPAADCNVGVRVKNSYNRGAPGTLISAGRDMAGSLMTSIVMKSNVTLVDIVSTRMMGQFGFLAKVFKVFEENKISVDVVATSEVSVSLTLDPAK